MNPFQDTTLIVLAAGRATRFGTDKLSQPLGTQPLATHLLSAVAPLHFAERILVSQGQNWRAAYEAAGFEAMINNGPEQGLSSSLRLGLAASSASDILILLADMPFVTSQHLGRIGQAFVQSGRRPVVSVASAYRGPPAMAPKDLLLAAPLMGDQGARAAFKTAQEVPTGPGELDDIDLQEDLAAAQAR